MKYLPNILIVDDKVSNIGVLEGLLEELGYCNIKSTTDSRLASGLFNSFKPDIILLDLMMPHMDGFEVMAALRSQIPANTYLPILLLTADKTTEVKERALSEGAKDFLTKPFELKEVELRIHNILETGSLYNLLEQQNQVLEEKVKERTLDLENAIQQLDLANKELKLLDQSKLDFLHLISHEIRTPLNGIFGFADILKSEIQSTALLDYLSSLEESARRLERFSYQALLITELRTGNYQIYAEMVPLQELLITAIRKHEDKIRSKSIQVIIQNDHAIGGITVEASLVELCFEILIDNAIKYSPNNEVVTIRIVPGGQTSIIVEFIDRGPGFSGLAFDRLFNIFTLSDKHIDENTGLNLALVKLIMDAHQAEISVKNNPDAGATLTLVFKNYFN